MEKTVRAFNHLINTGKALYRGTSDWSPDEMRKLGGTPISWA
jgi:aryl-alcohol dehydrogenase-like predicted oxidoreductase